MNDQHQSDSTSESSNPAQDPLDQSVNQPIQTVIQPIHASQQRTSWDTPRRFLACNPFYLVSAALLLYSFYLISADQAFLAKETQQLTFNLCSLQVYELLLVATAIFLAWRSVWYDSTLLVGLENMLVLVPFILISQAALIDEKLVWALSSAAALLALTRVNVLKRFIARLNFPRFLLLIGVGTILINAALPIIYRILHESKVGTRPDWGAAYETNQYVWWLMVPAMCALIRFISFSRSKPGQPWPERPWLPAGLFSLWLVGTGVHLYCLGYVYDFALRPELIAPAVWSLFWIFWLKTSQSLTDLPAIWARGLLCLPLLAPLLAAPQVEKGVFIVLTICNLALYARLYFKERLTLQLHLTLISLVTLCGGLPQTWAHALAPQLSREAFLAGAALLYVLGCIASTRNPKLGVFGAFLIIVTVGQFLDRPDATHWAFQAGLVFLILHSLRWSDSAEPGTKIVRWLVAAIWVAHSVVWTHLYDAGFKPCLLAVVVIAVCLLVRFLRGQWASIAVLIAALLVCISVPGHSATVHLASAPSGLLALLGSFFLFALGTLGALTKSYWHPPANPKSSNPTS